MPKPRATVYFKKLTGVPELTKALAACGRNAVKAAEKALYQEGEEIMADSKAHYVPVDTGSLRASGHVERPTTRGTMVQVELAYGGPAADYALFVHERLGVHHPVGGPKYLERPMLAAEKTFSQRLAKRIEGQVHP